MSVHRFTPRRDRVFAALVAQLEQITDYAESWCVTPELNHIAGRMRSAAFVLEDAAAVRRGCSTATLSI